MEEDKTNVALVSEERFVMIVEVGPVRAGNCDLCNKQKDEVMLVKFEKDPPIDLCEKDFWKLARLKAGRSDPKALKGSVSAVEAKA